MTTKTQEELYIENKWEITVARRREEIKKEKERVTRCKLDEFGKRIIEWAYMRIKLLETSDKTMRFSMELTPFYHGKELLKFDTEDIKRVVCELDESFTGLIEIEPQCDGEDYTILVNLPDINKPGETKLKSELRKRLSKLEEDEKEDRNREINWELYYRADIRATAKAIIIKIYKTFYEWTSDIPREGCITLHATGLFSYGQKFIEPKTKDIKNAICELDPSLQSYINIEKDPHCFTLFTIHFKIPE